MAFRVSYSAEAERNLDELFEWLLQQGAGNTASRWLQGLQEAIGSLQNQPSRCGLAPESEMLSLEVRQLLYGSKSNVYRILFTIEDEVVNVLHIRHGRRLPLDRL